MTIVALLRIVNLEAIERVGEGASDGLVTYGTDRGIHLPGLGFDGGILSE